mgnify:FL=1
MNTANRKEEMDNEDVSLEIDKIVRGFDSDREILPTKMNPYDDAAGIIPRLMRAAGNQVDQCAEPGRGSAMFSRYAIWAATLQGVLKIILVNMEQGSLSDSDKKHLIKVINSLSAFCEVQQLLDPLSEE